MPATKLETLRAKNAFLAGKLPNPTNRQQRAKLEEKWRVGELLRYEEKVWRVGLVSDMRMRLDPVTPNVKHIGDMGVSINHYGGSVNVSPSSILPKITEKELDDTLRKRIAKLEERPADTPERIVNQEEAKVMAVAAAPTAATVVVAAKPKAKAGAAAVQPVQAEVSDVKKANKDRLERLKAKNQATVKTAPSPVQKVEKAKRACGCGCGEMVGAYFAQGHDARFKSWLLKVERGTMMVKELPLVVQKAYQWKKKGEGYIPTKNYKGEPHVGYDPQELS